MQNKQEFARMMAEDRKFGEKTKNQKQSKTKNGGVKKNMNFKNFNAKDFAEVDLD